MYQYCDMNLDRPTIILPSYSLMRHEQQTQTVRYECSKCDSLFTTRTYLHEHEATVHNRIFHCPFCPSLFSNKPDYRTHIMAHTDKKYLPCAFCKRVFDQMDEYAAHLKVHREPCLFPCDKCPAIFMQYSKLRAHYAIHAQKKFVHTIPEDSESFHFSPKKLPKKILKRLDYKKIMAVVKHPHHQAQNNQTTNLTIPTISEVIDLVLDKSPSDSAADTQKNICKRGHLAKNSYLESYASTSTNPVSASVTSSSNSAKNAPVRSKIRPVVKKNISTQCEPPSQEKDDSDYLNSAPSTNIDLNKRKTNNNTNSKKHLHSRNRIMSYEVDDSDTAPPTSANSDKIKSSSNINSYRNLRCRETFKNLNQGKPKASYNLRQRAEKKSTYVEVPLPTDKIEKPSSPSSHPSTSTGFFMCLSCNRTFLSYRLLNQHKELHIKNKGLYCSGCGGLFGGACNLATHKKSSQCSTLN